MEIMLLLLSPVVEAMRVFLMTAEGATGDFGVAIILLGIAVGLLTAPIARLAARAEERSRQVQAAMGPELAEICATSKGRARFERTEALYQQHGYHPIHSVKALLPLFLQVPFLLAAFFLLSDFAPLAGESFLFIPDLLQPDRLLTAGAYPVNLLPLLVTAIALVESAIRTGAEPGSRIRFLILAVVIAALIYSAAAAVCLYWLTGNLLSLGRAVIVRFGSPPSKAHSA